MDDAVGNRQLSFVLAMASLRHRAVSVWKLVSVARSSIFGIYTYITQRDEQDLREHS